MNSEKKRAILSSVSELSESYSDLIQTLKGTTQQVRDTKKLWNSGNKSKLIKLGLALIIFPEPTPVSETIGAFLIASGVVQQGIRRRDIYVEDVLKTFRNTMSEVKNMQLTSEF